MVVYASGCVSLLLYVLLYEADKQAAEQLVRQETAHVKAYEDSKDHQHYRKPVTSA